MLHLFSMHFALTVDTFCIDLCRIDLFPPLLLGRLGPSAADDPVAADDLVDALLEAAEIQRRVYRSGGPAILFRNVKDCSFPMVSNLFGTVERARYLFRDTIEQVKRLIELKTDPGQVFRHPWKYRTAPRTALHMLPQRRRRGAILRHETNLHSLPQLKSWPDDGGAFVTLPLVYTEPAGRPGLRFQVIWVELEQSR